MNVAFAFSNTVQLSGVLPQLQLARARRQPGPRRAHGIRQPDQRLAEKQGSVQKERKCDHLCRRAGFCLVLVSSSFSTRTSYENQTKKAITNKFVLRP